jgi:mono/diheme cytochrome c family protein
MSLRWLGYLAGLAYWIALSGVAQAQTVAEGKSLYTSYCAACHGDQGKGDGVAARSLPVKPADHTNGTVMNQFSDKFLTDIITKGGSAVNKSAFMPAWRSSLNNKQVSDIVAYMRSIANPPYNKADGVK